MQSAEGVVSALEEYTAMDTDHDGTISVQEEFNAIDLNHDGMLSTQEYNKRSDRVRAIKRNKSVKQLAAESLAAEFRMAKELAKKELEVYQVRAGVGNKSSFEALCRTQFAKSSAQLWMGHG